MQEAVFVDNEKRLYYNTKLGKCTIFGKRRGLYARGKKRTGI